MDRKRDAKRKPKLDQRPLYVKISILHSYVLCAVLIILTVIISGTATDILMEKEIQNCRKDIYAISEKINMLLNGYKKDAQAIITNQKYQETLLTDASGNESENTLRALKMAITLADFQSSYSRIEKIRFYDVVRRKITDNYTDHNYRENVSGSKDDHSWYAVDDFISQNRASTCTPFRVEEGSGSSISVLHRVNNYNGKFVGVLELVIHEAQINHMYSELESRDVKFYLLDKAGINVSASDKALLGKRILDDAQLNTMTLDGGSIMEAEINGVRSLVISKYLDGLDCRLVGIISQNSIKKDVNTLKEAIFVVCILGIVVGILLVLWTSRKSTYPLERVLQVIASVSKGNYGERVDTQQSGEYFELSTQLNEMIDSLVNMMNLVHRQEEQKRMYELQNLHMQLNPHFLYNSLETVCGIIDDGDGKLAIKMVNDISRFYRGILSGGSSTITVEQEIGIILKYLEIVQIRYKDAFDFHIDIQPELLSTKIPKLILQPIVENAIVHGFIGSKEHGNLVIEGSVQDGEGIIRISDDGMGISQADMERIMTRDTGTVSKSGGFGLHSVDERLKLFFGEAYGVKISSQYGVGTCITISIPMKHGDENNGNSVNS